MIQSDGGQQENRMRKPVARFKTRPKWRVAILTGDGETGCGKTPGSRGNSGKHPSAAEAGH